MLIKYAGAICWRLPTKARTHFTHRCYTLSLTLTHTHTHTHACTHSKALETAIKNPYEKQTFDLQSK